MTMKRISSLDSDCSRFMFRKQCGIVVLIAFALAGLIACERTPDQATESKNAVVADRPGVVHLTAEELGRTVLEVVPVARGAMLVPRQYTATVQANENELAEVTTLIRGRVEKVYVDVGQDVKKEALLAMLHSTDLGVAEGAYLKSAAKLYEAKRAYERTRDLYEQKVVSLAELQRREAMMKMAQAEAREARNRLELLGVSRQEVERLDREGTIKAMCHCARRSTAGASCATSREAKLLKRSRSSSPSGIFGCVGSRQCAGGGRAVYPEGSEGRCNCVRLSPCHYMEKHIRRLSFTIRWDSVPARGWRYPHQTEGRTQIVFSLFGSTGREGI